MKKKLILSIALILGLTNLNALVVSGHFTANSKCPLYQSKNKKTNSGNLFTSINQQYLIKGMNSNPPSWLQVEASSNKELRWVATTCGRYALDDLPTCDLTPGHANSYVFAVSLQPGFCEVSGAAKNKPECKALTKNSKFRTQFTLHGLWPNQTVCGTSYGFCDNTPQEKSFCDYTPLSLSVDTKQGLENNMPSYLYGSCLERHEWYKHGSCQLRSQDDYYSVAVRFVEQLNQTPLKDFISSHLGQTVSVTSLQTILNHSLGALASKKIKLVCGNNNILTDLYIDLPDLDNNFESNLFILISKATDAESGKCTKQIKISDFSAN